MIKKIRDIIQDCNLNFLLGSGLSAPYLKTLGTIESLLTEVEQRELPRDEVKLIRASLYRKYFVDALAKNLGILTDDDGAGPILENYRQFVRLINSILLRRKSSILNKEANLFTTNVDIFLEKALEDAGLEYNDGFNGRFRPVFALSNFKKSRSKRSLHYDNTSELPVFNLLKLHGSLCWQLAPEDTIVYSTDLAQVRVIAEVDVLPENCLEISDETTIQGLMQLAQGRTSHESLRRFAECYEQLLIVNPTKDKFKSTLLNQTYYELLRIYSNELERENTVLFVMGFSFADEHIRELTLRVANSNPTLAVYVFAHSGQGRVAILERLRLDRVTNRNIEVFGPPQKDGEDEFKYDLTTTNDKLFGALFADENRSAEAY
jgi:hypothetical protein